MSEQNEDKATGTPPEDGLEALMSSFWEFLEEHYAQMKETEKDPSKRKKE